MNQKVVKMMLKYKDYKHLLCQTNNGKNFHLWGRSTIGKTYVIQQALLKDTSCEVLYLALDYPFDIDSIFLAISIGFELYAGADWQKIVQSLSSGSNKLLVLDDFDRLHCSTNNLSSDLSKLKMLANLDNLSLLTGSHQPLHYFNFQSFASLFENFQMDESNTHIF